MCIHRDCVYLAGDDVFILLVNAVLHLVLSIGGHVISEVPRVMLLFNEFVPLPQSRVSFDDLIVLHI